MAAQIFLSHSSKDVVAARALKQALGDAGISSFMAPDDIAGNLPWAEQIADALRDCDATIVLLSKAANDSPHVAREVSIALAAEKPVVPVRLELVQPARSLQYLLQLIQWVDAFPGSLDSYIGQITTRARSAMGGTTPRDPPPVPRDPPPRKAQVAATLQWLPHGSATRILMAAAALAIVAGLVWLLSGGGRPGDPSSAPSTPATAIASAPASVLTDPPASVSVTDEPTGEPTPTVSTAPSAVVSPSPPTAGLPPLNGYLAYVRRSGAERTLVVQGFGDVAGPSISLGDGEGPRWSPDGAELIFSTAEGLATWTADKGVVALSVADPDLTSLSNPSWASDGRRIAFDAQSSATERFDIYILGRDASGWSTKPTALDTGLDLARQPSFAPCGDRLALSGYFSGAGSQRQVHIISLSGGNVNSIETRSEPRSMLSPEWSPNGNELVFQSGASSSAELRRLSLLDPGAPSQLIPFRGAFKSTPSWSPDATEVLFSALGETERAQIFRIRLVDNVSAPVTTGNPDQDHGEPAWFDRPNPKPCSG